MDTTPEKAQEPRLEVSLLGELTVRRGGDTLRLPQSKKTRALLGYLVVTGRPQRRKRLCSLLWDVADDPRGALRWCLSKIRPIVNQPGATRIVTDGDTVLFDAGRAEVDLFVARRAVRDGVDSLETTTLIELASSYRGELLEGLEMSDFDEFQAWCLAEREEARASHSKVLRALVDRLRDEPERALPHARALVRIEPVDEAVRAQLVALLTAAGRTAEAQQQIEASVRQLRELGVEPTGLLEAARQESPRPAPDASPPRTADSAALDPILVTDTPLIGRRAERAHLTDVVTRVSERRRERLSLISGEPGVGKTRLFVDLLEQVRHKDGLVLAGRAYEAERGRPFGPWIDALRSIPQIAAAPSVNALGPLLPELAGEEQSSSREGMFAAVVELLASLSSNASMVAIALDDVQWIDEASAELLHFVARRLRDQPFLIAMTARSGEIVDNGPIQRALRSLRKERLLDELEVGPLSQTDTVALVNAVSPGADAAEVFSQCAGNPLFALELARSGPRESGAPSQTLTDVVRERVERLPAEAEDVLRWAAALGPTSEITRLLALTELSDEELLSAVELLERRALLTSEGTSYHFAHDVVRHVVYNELSEPRRQLMHAKIAQSIDLASSGDGVVAAELAHHAHLAGDAAMAARACIAAGGRSLKLFANSDALALCRRGFRYIERLPEPGRTIMAIDLWSIRLGAAVADDGEAAAEQLERLGGLALDSGNDRAARRAFRLLGYLRWEHGETIDAARHMLNAARLTKHNDGVERASALADAARCLVRLDRELGHAEALTLEARAIVSKLDERSPTVADAEGLLRFYEGDIDAAAAHFTESAELARSKQDRMGEFEPLENLVMLKVAAERPEEARDATQRLLDLGARMREGSEAPTSRSLHAVVCYAAGDPGARTAVLEAQEELRIVDAKQRLGFSLLATAATDLENGDPDAARRCAQEALKLVTVLSHGTYVAWARALIVEAAVATGDDEIAAHYREALATNGVEGLASFVREAVNRVL